MFLDSLYVGMTSERRSGGTLRELRSPGGGTVSMMYPRASRAAVTLTSCGPITINPFLCAIATMTATAGTMSSSPVASVKEQGRLRVLVIAELANPDWESVPLVGWSHWRALSKIVDGHLVTQIRNEENILKAGEPRERFTALDSTPVERQVDRVGKVLRGRAGGGVTTMTALSALSYYYFEDPLLRRFGKGIAAGKWDVVHRLTPLSPTTPSLLAAKCRRHGVPFVLGPINGGVPRPKGFAPALRAEREWLTHARAAHKPPPADA